MLKYDLPCFELGVWQGSVKIKRSCIDISDIPPFQLKILPIHISLFCFQHNA